MAETRSTTPPEAASSSSAENGGELVLWHGGTPHRQSFSRPRCPDVGRWERGRQIESRLPLADDVRSQALPPRELGVSCWLLPALNARGRHT